MPKRQPIKMWDKPKELVVIRPSKYEIDDPKVKRYWKDVIRNLELTFKDDKFWDTNKAKVKKIVSAKTFKRIVKIYDLIFDESRYKVDKVDVVSVNSASLWVNRFIKEKSNVFDVEEESLPASFSDEVDGEELEEETVSEELEPSLEGASVQSIATTIRDVSQYLPSRVTLKSAKSVKSVTTCKSKRSRSKSFISRQSGELRRSSRSDTKAGSHDTIAVNVGDDARRQSGQLKKQRSKMSKRSSSLRLERASRSPNFFHDMLYGCASLTDMITWDTKLFKKDNFRVSDKDDFTKKSDMVTKKIATEFFEWYDGLGTVEFKSDIKCPEDVETLFQVWFDEHASRSLVIDPKIIPCVLKTIAEAIGLPEASCDAVLRRQLAWDITAEKTPAHMTAFNSSLPYNLKHLPPRNNTKKLWMSLETPKELESLECVWNEIEHLTSTKKFTEWLVRRPFLPMPPYLQEKLDSTTPALFVLPSDYMIRTVDEFEVQEENLDMSTAKSEIEMERILSRLMNT